MGHFGTATYQYLARPAMKKSIVPKLKSTLRSYYPNVYTVSWTSFLLELNHDNVCLPSSFFYYQFYTVWCTVASFTVFTPVEQVLCSLKSHLCAIKYSATRLVFVYTVWHNGVKKKSYKKGHFYFKPWVITTYIHLHGNWTDVSKVREWE